MKKVLYRVLLIVNAFFAFTLLMSYLAVHINPDDFVLPAFFGLAYPYLLLINIILVIIWAMLLRFEALISIIVIALGITHFSNYIKLSKPGGDKTNTFKVISYNLRMFNYLENKSKNNSEKKILEFLHAQKPDIICLQEFFEPVNAAEKTAAFKTALGSMYYSQMKSTGNRKNRFYGNATFTRFPIIRQGELNHPGSSSITIFTDVLIGKDTFRIYNNHLQSFRLRKIERSFLDEMTASNDNETIEDVKSLSKNLKKAFARRALQSQALKDNINTSPFPVIVAGDFNDTPVSYSYHKIRKGLNDSFVNSGYGAGFTYRGSYPPNRIDYILYDNALINSYFEIIKIKYSDHFPIVAYFRKKD
ncbi:MAG: endonuclease/exonuclease/phosphatase family protein [Bacteroidota bacterium]